VTSLALQLWGVAAILAGVLLAWVGTVLTRHRIDRDGLLMPAGDIKLFALPLLRSRPNDVAEVEFTSVSDFGARVRHSAPLAPPAAR